MNSPGIPENEISWLSADLDLGAASLFEPLDLFWRESEPVGRAPGLSLCVMSLEEGLVECARPLQDDEPSVLGTVRGKIEDPLDALQSSAKRALVDVRPCLYRLSIFRGEGQVDTIEGDKKVFGLPELGKGIYNCRFPVVHCQHRSLILGNH